MNNTKVGTDDLNKYLFLNSLMDHSNVKLLVGVSNAIVN